MSEINENSNVFHLNLYNKRFRILKYFKQRKVLTKAAESNQNNQ